MSKDCKACFLPLKENGFKRTDGHIITLYICKTEGCELFNLVIEGEPKEWVSPS